jgi:hypothetical protein
VETHVSFSELSQTIQLEFFTYLGKNLHSAGCFHDWIKLFLSHESYKSLVQVLSKEQNYLFDEAMAETVLTFQVIGYDNVFCWTHKEKEECPF